MLRNFACASIIVVVALGLAVAEEVKGKITKIDDKSVTVVNKNFKDGKTYDLDAKCKVCKMVKGNKEEVATGVKGIDPGTKGVNATLVVDDKTNKVSEIILTGKKKKTK